MKDYCKDCPAYYSDCDYWGEWDEGCELHGYAWFDGKGYKLFCRLPKIIKKLYLKFYRWQDERHWYKEVKEQEDE